MRNLFSYGSVVFFLNWELGDFDSVPAHQTATHGYSLGSFLRSLNLKFVMVNYSDISKNKNCCDSLSWPMDTDLLYSWLHHSNLSNLSQHASKKTLFHFRLHEIMQTKCVPTEFSLSSCFPEQVSKHS